MLSNMQTPKPITITQIDEADYKGRFRPSPYEVIGEIPGAGGSGTGPAGPSAYQAWLDLGNVGTKEQFLTTLRGEPGPEGAQGEPGAAGAAGARGADGVTGPRGDKGDTGPKGDKGDRGDQGIQGLLGPQGVAGVAGAEGVQGPRGDRGADGTSIVIDGYEATVGDLPDLTGQPAGPSYVVMATGHIHFWNGTGYTDGGNVTGPAGADGEPGAQGPRGEKGETGPQGLQGLQGVAGTKGDKGDSGLRGPQGVQGDRGLQGEKGDPGEQGPRGIQGIQGINGVNGAQGIRGLPGDTGPKGDTGSQGPQGLQGPQGIQGAQGVTGPGVATGGTTGQVLVKSSNTNYATQWVNRNPSQSEVGGRRVITGSALNNTSNDITDFASIRIRTRNVSGVPNLEFITTSASGTYVDYGSLGYKGATTTGVSGRSGNNVLLTNSSWTLLSGAADYCSFMIRNRNNSQVWEGSFLAPYVGANAAYSYTLSLTRTL